VLRRRHCASEVYQTWQTMVLIVFSSAQPVRTHSIMSLQNQLLKVIGTHAIQLPSYSK